MPFLTMLLITVWFPLRDLAQVHQPPASGSHPLPSCFKKLFLHLLGAAEDVRSHQVFCVLINTHESSNHRASGPRVIVEGEAMVRVPGLVGGFICMELAGSTKPRGERKKPKQEKLGTPRTRWQGQQKHGDKCRGMRKWKGWSEKEGRKEDSLENCCPQKRCLIHALHSGAVWRRATSGQGKGSRDKLGKPWIIHPSIGKQWGNGAEERDRGVEEKAHQRHQAEILSSFAVWDEAPISLFHVFFGLFSSEAPWVACYLSSKETPAKQARLLTWASQSAVIYIAVPP